MKKSSKTSAYKECEKEFIRNDCSNCEAPKMLKRIDKQYILKEIGSVLNFDRGLFYTVKELLIRPGKTVRQFIFEDRNRLVKPILFLIICSLIYTLTHKFFKFNDGYINFNFDDIDNQVIAKIFLWVSKNYGYANILMAVFIALWINVFFKKFDYNYYEIYILLCFIMGVSMLIFTLFGIVESVINYPVLQYGANIGILYVFWGIGRFFDSKRKRNYLKGILSYFLGMFTFILVLVLMGVLIDKII